MIVSDPVTTAVAGQPYTYPVKAIDPDNDPLTYSLTTAPAGMTIDPATGLITWPAAASNTTVTTFSDGTFNNGDWAATKIVDTTPDPSQSSMSAQQTATGGNPGPYLGVTQSASGTGTVTFGNIDQAAVYDPRTSGAISTIDLSFDHQVDPNLDTESAGLSCGGRPEWRWIPRRCRIEFQLKYDLGLSWEMAMGSFKPPIDFSTIFQPGEVVLGDFNGDGILDVVTANASVEAQAATRWRCTWAAETGPSIHPSFSRRVGMFSALSLATSTEMGTSILSRRMPVQRPCQYCSAMEMGRCALVRITPRLGTVPRGLALADVNEDGHLDIITGNLLPCRMSVPSRFSWESGTGSFASPTN